VSWNFFGSNNITYPLAFSN